MLYVRSFIGAYILVAYCTSVMQARYVLVSIQDNNEIANPELDEDDRSGKIKRMLGKLKGKFNVFPKH